MTYLRGVCFIHIEHWDTFPQGFVFELGLHLIGGHGMDFAVVLLASGIALSPWSSMVLQIPDDDYWLKKRIIHIELTHYFRNFNV